MNGSEMPRVLVIGVGNPDRGDDGVGRSVVCRLRQQIPSTVSVIELAGDALALIEAWEGFSAVILVDAMEPATKPGKIHRFNLTNNPLPITATPHSSHAFGLAEAIELARSLGRLPSALVAYLIEGERFETGAPLSPTSEHAAELVADKILVELATINDAFREGAGRHA
jgi:hydrogenase maturation protease